MPSEAIAQAMDALLGILGALGVPGAPVAQHAGKAIESLRQSREARARFEDLLRKAEEEFIREARAAGLEPVAQWVISLPIQNLPTFRQALERLQAHWDEESLIAVLARELAAIPGVSSEDRARALALYMACLRGRLVADPAFHPLILGLSILRTERDVKRLLEGMDQLYRAVSALRGLPEDLVAWPVEDPPPGTDLRADLLLPRYRLVPYTGKAFQQALGDLLAWARGLEGAQPPVGLRIYTGSGGAGKTRLLIEAGEVLRREGWWVGFLRLGRLTAENARMLSADPRPTLLIVDYIADRSEEVRRLLREVARARNERPAPIALILLERTFPDWLKGDLSDYTDPEYVGWPAFLGLPTIEKQPRSLPTPEAGDRRELFQAAWACFVARIGRADTRPPAEPDLPEAPLYILLLALLRAAGERVDRPTDPGAILECTWRREQKAWARHLSSFLGNPPEAQQRRALETLEGLVTLATLGRRFPTVEAIVAFLQAHPRLFRPIPGIEWGDFAEALSRIFPHRAEGVIPPIAPDPLADFVLMPRLEERPALLSLALPTPEEAEADPEAAAQAAGQALNVLSRLYERATDPTAREKVAGWMAEAAAHLAGWPDPAWEALDRALPAPDRTLALRPFLSAFYQARLAQTPPVDLPERARLLGMLGLALSALGRREEALAATEEAVGIRRQLAQAHPQAFLPYLASSLNNLGNRLSDLGRREEALAATEEAVGIRRQLAQAHPQAFLPYLASSLNNLGNRLSDLGRREEALAATEEAVGIRRQLAQAHPQAFLPYLASSLNNLGNRLSDLGRREEALAATEEAVGIYRQLAQAHPQAFLPDLAISLNNLGDRFSELGQQMKALKAYEEAARRMLPFYRAYPAAFASRMRYMLRDYLNACRALGQAPDPELLKAASGLLE